MMAPTAVLPLWWPMTPPMTPPAAAPPAAPFCVFDMLEQLMLPVASARTSTPVAIFFIKTPPGCLVHLTGDVCKFLEDRRLLARLEPDMELCKEI
jgi:hypothetical protein